MTKCNYTNLKNEYYDISKRKKSFVRENFNYIAKQINNYYDENKSFILKDLLEKNKHNTYYIYMTKGIILSLLNSDHLDIVSLNGNQNYYYKCVKKIKLNE